MSNSNASGRRRRRLWAASISAALIVTPQAQAFERIIRGVDRFVYCAGLMLSDPKTHAENCLPSRVVSPPDSLLSGNSDPGPVTLVAPPPPPVVANEPEPEIENPGSGPADA
jgi:hypothetical protein